MIIEDVTSYGETYNSSWSDDPKLLRLTASGVASQWLATLISLTLAKSGNSTESHKTTIFPDAGALFNDGYELGLSKELGYSALNIEHRFR